jgi:hypothetical protein
MTRHRGQRPSGALTRCTLRRPLTGSWRTPLKMTSLTRIPSIQIRPPLSETSRKRGRIQVSSAPAGCRDARPPFRAGTLHHLVLGEVLRGGAITPREPSVTRISLARGATQGAAPDTGANGQAAASTVAAIGVGGEGVSRNRRSPLLISVLTLSL